jgi:hypothetical protein
MHGIRETGEQLKPSTRRGTHSEILEGLTALLVSDSTPAAASAPAAPAAPDITREEETTPLSGDVTVII